MELKGKTIVITGTSSGIGKEVALQCLELGAKVFGLSRRQGDLTHDHFQFIQCNVRNESEVIAAFDRIGECDALINNAGLGRFNFLEQTSSEEWIEMFETNVHSIYYCTKQVIESMKRRGSGHIINIASTAGLEGYATATAYCGTKFAVRGISLALYKEVRDYGVKVTCVYPGSIQTDFFAHHPNIEPHGNMLNPKDIAKMIVQALRTADNFHQVNLEIRPLQPKGVKKWE